MLLSVKVIYLHIYRYLAFLACELQGVTLLTGALNKHGPMGNKPIGQRKGIYRQHSGKQLFREKQKELELGSSTERVPCDVIVDIGSPASTEQTRYHYQDGTAWCAASGSQSWIVSVILDGGQYRSRDLPTMFLTGSGPLKCQSFGTNQECVLSNEILCRRFELGCNLPDVRIEAVVAVVSQHEHITFRNKLQRCPTEMRRVSTLTQQDEQPCQQ